MGRLSLHGGNYDARFYDPALARWHSVDPMAEMYYHAPTTVWEN
ncbi:MAG: hypothetical protein PF436_06325 [Prolixibacteraceae bacterium]|nr:hypothetical protein [Prolixibacteraceae bacterium]